MLVFIEELEARLQERLMELNFDVSIFGDDMENYEKYIKYVHHEVPNPVTAAKIIHSAMTELYGLTDEQFNAIHEIYYLKRLIQIEKVGTLMYDNKDKLTFFVRERESGRVRSIVDEFYKPIKKLSEYPKIYEN